MDSLEAEIGAEQWDVDVHFLGVNGIGYENGNIEIHTISDLPWLQDSEMQRVWERWHADYRDIIILDAENLPVAVFNVTTYDLKVPENFDSLRTLLAECAAGERSPGRARFPANP